MKQLEQNNRGQSDTEGSSVNNNNKGSATLSVKEQLEIALRAELYQTVKPTLQ